MCGPNSSLGIYPIPCADLLSGITSSTGRREQLSSLLAGQQTELSRLSERIGGVASLRPEETLRLLQRANSSGEGVRGAGERVERVRERTEQAREQIPQITDNVQRAESILQNTEEKCECVCVCV